MKRLTCEMCGSTDLVKQDGVFVCQSCGCKYSVEEARKMMIEGTVEITGTVQIDNSAMINNYLKLAENACNGKNGQTAYEYTSKVLEMEPENYKAWHLQARALEFLVDENNERGAEFKAAGENALKFSPEEEKANFEQELYAMNLRVAVKGFIETNKKMHNLVQSNMPISNSQIDRIMESHTPYHFLAMDVPYENLVKDYGMIYNLKECASLYSDIMKVRFDGLCKADPMFALNTSKIGFQKPFWSTKQEEIAKKAAADNLVYRKEERRKKIQAYWEEHYKEYETLINKKKDLQNQIEVLKKSSEESSLNHELNELAEKIENVKLAKKNAGIFNLKEKKKLQEQIDTLENMLHKKQEEYREENNRINKKIDEVMPQLKDIENELNKDR